MTGTAVAPRLERRREFTPNATLAERDELTPLVARYVVHPDAPGPPFEPGQYFSLGLEIDAHMILRPYSTASPRGATEALEFLIRHVPAGTFTPELWHAAVGDRLWIGPPKGLFMLKPNDARTHLLISSGTGISPFMSMLDELLSGADDSWRQGSAADAGNVPLPAAPVGPRVVVAHGVSYASELAYRQRLELLAAADPRLAYVPTVSRPDEPKNAGWAGRTGRVDAILAAVCGELRLDPSDTVAYLCGNPDMVARSEEVLRSLGFAADAVIHENYWTAAVA